MKTEVQILNANDLEALNDLISVFEEAFEMENFKKPDKKHLESLLHKDTFIAATAKVDNKVVGGLTAYVLEQYYSIKPLVYLYDLAVSADYQRKGIGQKLIETTNEYCRQKGFEEVFVQAHRADEHAIDFYRSTKPTREEKVVHFSYTLSN